MGTSLAGSQILGTYSGLLKTTDNAALNATLRTLTDGVGTDSAFKLATASAQVIGTFDVSGAFTLGGNFSVATNKFTVNATSGNTLVAGTLDSTGNFAVATNKFTVAAASGNTVVAGTLNVTGNLSGSQGVTGRSLTASDAAGTSALAGGLTVGTTSVFSGQATFNGLVIFNAALTLNAGITAPTVTATTSSALGTASCGSLTSTGFVSVGGNLSVTGNITGNGNVTIGDAAGDSLTLNAATWTTPNIPSVQIDSSADSVLINDASDGNKVKKVSASQFAFGIKKATRSSNSYSYSPASAGPNVWEMIQSASGVDWSLPITVTQVGNQVSIEVQVNFHATYSGPTYLGVSTTELFAIGLFVDGASVPSAVSISNISIYAQSAGGGNTTTYSNGMIRLLFIMTTTASSHTFKFGIMRRFGNNSAITMNNQSPWTSAEVGYPSHSAIAIEYA